MSKRCTSGPCDTLEIGGFVTEVAAPINLGQLTGDRSCLTFPTRHTVAVTKSESYGWRTWTIKDQVSLKATTVKTVT